MTACRFRVLTLFPEMFPGPLGSSLAGKALEAGLWQLHTLNIRDFATDRHASVDDAPFGGGAGMVLRPEILAAAVDAALEPIGGRAGAPGEPIGGRASAPGGDDAVASGQPLVYFSPRGRALDQALVSEVAIAGGATLICGRFEGVDERAIEALRESRGLIEVSLGDFILSGGEIAGLALMDAVVRTLPGVLGQASSLTDESFSAGLLEYPHYTRPRIWQGRAVPEVLLSGDHVEIKAWRRAEAERLTKSRRPDLWARYKNHNQQNPKVMS